MGRKHSARLWLDRLAKSRAGKVDIEGMAEALIDAFGGIPKFAKTAKDEFDKSAPGSMNRGRLLANVTEIVARASAKSTLNDPIKDMSTEDLEMAIHSGLRKAKKRWTPKKKLPADGVDGQ